MDSLKNHIAFVQMAKQVKNKTLIFEQKSNYVQRAASHLATRLTGRIKIDAPTSFHLVKFKPSHKL